MLEYHSTDRSLMGSSDLESTNLCHTSEGWYPETFYGKKQRH